MNSIYLTDKDFKALDKELRKIESDIDNVLLKPIINWKKVDRLSQALEYIRIKLDNTKTFAKGLK